MNIGLKQRMLLHYGHNTDIYYHNIYLAWFLAWFPDLRHNTSHNDLRHNQSAPQMTRPCFFFDYKLECPWRTSRIQSSRYRALVQLFMLFCSYLQPRSVDYTQVTIGICMELQIKCKIIKISEWYLHDWVWWILYSHYVLFSLIKVALASLSYY